MNTKYIVIENLHTSTQIHTKYTSLKDILLFALKKKQASPFKIINVWSQKIQSQMFWSTCVVKTFSGGGADDSLVDISLFIEKFKQELTPLQH